MINNLKLANKALRDKQYSLALGFYEVFISENPELAESISFNLNYCKRKISEDMNVDYSNYFDDEWYRENYMDKSDNQTPFDHYQKNIFSKIVNPNKLFDVNYTRELLKLDNKIDPLLYYINSLKSGGIDFLINGFSPSPFFDRKFYIGHNDVYQNALSGYDPYLHFLQYGMNEGRRAYHWQNYNEIVRHRQFHTDFSNKGSFFSKPGSLKIAIGEISEKFYLNNQIELAKNIKNAPLISVIVPLFETKPRFLIEMIESVLKQTYNNWQLCLVDDKSIRNREEIFTIVERYVSKDSRIIFKARESNGHICVASNDAISIASGEYIALLDHDDTLSPDALYEVALAIINNSNPDIIYSDEDKVTEWGIYCGPYYKPDWSPHSILTRMYCCHLCVYKRSILESVGGFRLGFEGSQDHDLLLRCSEITNKIHHIPKILYHWRMHQESTAGSDGGLAKEYCSDAALRAVKDALYRRNIEADVGLMLKNHSLITVKPKVKGTPLVEIIIPSRDNVKYLEPCINSVFEKTTYENFCVTIINNGSISKDFYNLVKKFKRLYPKRFNVIDLFCEFNFSLLNNTVAFNSKSDYILFLNNDTVVITPDWIELLLGYAQLVDVGAVGAKLLYADETIQHAGVVTGPTGIATHVMSNQNRFSFGYNSNLALTTNYSAVTGACMLINKLKFIEIGGFDQNLAIAFNDIDLCLRVRDNGLYNVYVPYAELFHYESKSRGYEDSIDKVTRFEREIMYMRQKWGDSLENDPFYSRWLTLSDSSMGYIFEV